MTDEQAKNVLLEFCKEKLNLVKLFRWNASMKHGVPIDDTVKLSVNNEVKTKTESTSTSSVNSKSPFLGIYALITSLLLAIIGGAALTNYLKKDTVTQPNNTNVEADKTNSDLLLPWLEDRGEHLP